MPNDTPTVRWTLSPIQGLAEFLAKAEGERTMAGTKTTWRPVEGTEEEEYYQRVSQREEWRVWRKCGEGL